MVEGSLKAVISAHLRSTRRVDKLTEDAVKGIVDVCQMECAARVQRRLTKKVMRPTV